MGIIRLTRLGCRSGYNSSGSRSRGRKDSTAKRELARLVRDERPNPAPPSTQRVVARLCKLRRSKLR
jgi:hypothetical protein